MTTREFLTSAWTLNPLVIAVVMGAAAIYAWRFGVHRRAIFFVAALAVIAFALMSPVDALADGYLFSAHMAQHLLLLLVAPPLVLMSLPSREGGRRGARGQRFLLGWLAGLSAMWIWHAPALCSAATLNPMIHRVQYVSLLVAGTMFWWPLLSPSTGDRITPLAGVAYLFSACVGCTLLGVLVTFSPVSVCPAYLHPADRLGMLPLIRNGWGFTPQRDQQLGGLLMWVPGCLVYLAGIMGLLARWYGERENIVVGGTASPAR